MRIWALKEKAAWQTYTTILSIWYISHIWLRKYDYLVLYLKYYNNAIENKTKKSKLPSETSNIRAQVFGFETEGFQSLWCSVSGPSRWWESSLSISKDNLVIHLCNYYQLGTNGKPRYTLSTFILLQKSRLFASLQPGFAVVGVKQSTLPCGSWKTLLHGPFSVGPFHPIFGINKKANLSNLDTSFCELFFAFVYSSFNLFNSDWHSLCSAVSSACFSRTEASSSDI